MFRITLAVSAVLFSLLGSTGSAHADVACSAADAYGNQQCVAGLRSEIASTLYAPQRMNQWCWAASIAMVFKHHGYEVSQQRIVKEAWGGIVNMPGQPRQILASLNRVWTDSAGRRFRVSGDVYSANPPNAAADLAENRPLIIGTQGHAMVLTALTYARARNGAGTVINATVRDPWPGRGRRDLRADEWYQTMLLVRIRVDPITHGDTTKTRPGEGKTCRMTTTACTHPAHPQGDLSQCIHPAHPMGDLGPCQHPCPGPYGMVPCHPQGDAFPCQHPAHPMGDLSPCQHPAHPGGHPHEVCD